MQLMVQSITERVRLSAEEERRLQEVARRTGQSKSDVLRAGIESQWAKLELLDRRRAGFQELADLAAKYPGGPKLRFRLK